MVTESEHTGQIHGWAGDFPTADYTVWRQLADKALRGADFDDTLVRHTPDGLERGPVFFSAPETSGPVDTAPRDIHRPFAMRQTIVEAQPAEARQAALDDLMGGVSDLGLVLDPTGATGLKADTLDDLDAALDGIDLALAPVHLETLAGQGHHAHLLLALYARRRVDGETVTGSLGLDPVGRAARQGVAQAPSCFDKARDIAQLAHEAFPRLHVFKANGAQVFEAGGSEVQELAVTAASLAMYMRHLIGWGFTPDLAARAIELHVCVDADIHLGIAKLRAVRRVATQILTAFGVSETARRIDLHVTTAHRMLSASDPWTNLIRNACAGFAAAAGGADSLTVRPLTDAIGRPTRFGRRVARNLHILLAEESHVGKVTDPAAGSYLHETLTEQLARAAWSRFQAIEAEGGLAAAYDAGTVQAEIVQARTARLARIRNGDEAILGVTQYPDPDPRAVETMGRWPDMPDSDLSPMRFAAEFEGEAQ